MLKDYLEQGGSVCTVMRNDDPQLLESGLQFDALVLSPGPQDPKHAGLLMDVIHKYYEHKPILGVCLGHQAIGEFFGATLVKAAFPMHGKVDSILHTQDELFHSVPQTFSATRYHSLLLTQMPECLSVIAKSSKNEVMALKHKQLPIWGIQFHPESCQTEYGVTMIKNFLLAATPKQ
jgi:anthranilate synthase/aminodeoxychorismate synthase-like glutamine amidotransferase